MKKEYCFNCEKEVYPVLNKEKNTYKINGEKFEVEESIYRCPNCNNEIEIQDYDSINNIYTEYLKRYGLTFEDFKKIRNKYNLSQELFAHLLGWGKKTIERYENKESFPQKGYLDTYKKLKNGFEEFIKILNDNKERLKDDYYVILKKAKLFDYVKTINSFLYMLDDNPLGKTQIMKNMFALDFESYKEFGNKITTLNYANGTHGPIIDDYKWIINYLLHNNYIIMDPSFDEDKADTYLPNVKIDLTFFTKDEIKCMEKVKNKLKGKSAKELSLWSHKFIGWKATKPGEIINPKKYKDNFDLNTL